MGFFGLGLPTGSLLGHSAARFARVAAAALEGRRVGLRPILDRQPELLAQRVVGSAPVREEIIDVVLERPALAVMVVLFVGQPRALLRIRMLDRQARDTMSSSSSFQ